MKKKDDNKTISYESIYGESKSKSESDIYENNGNNAYSSYNSKPNPVIEEEINEKKPFNFKLLLIPLIVIVVIGVLVAGFFGLKYLNKVIKTVSISTNTLIINIDDKKDITVNNANPDMHDVKWKSDNEEIVKVEGDINKGTVTGVDYGTTKVHLTYLDKNNKPVDLICDVTVIQGSPDVPLTGISLDTEQKEMKIGESHQLKVTFTPPNGRVDNLVFESLDETVASVEKRTGLVRALKNGSTSIVCKANDGKLTATFQVTVKNNAQIVLKSSANLQLTIGQRTQINYEILDSTSKAEIKITDEKILRNIPALGANTIIATSPGTTTVRVYLVDDPNIYKDIQVTVSIPSSFYNYNGNGNNTNGKANNNTNTNGNNYNGNVIIH